ncbi:SIR2-like protein [Acholeplasma laidlawii]|uniref:Uncharacterized protein n=3 Tax=Acholeplasma laidlawii TaxID=2148 RepID=A9NH35_ACHLI|nr:hypothetical protein ACL_1055 [Acholeplasma laidlawii PG-8A]OED27067.1 hypothetical protein A9269_05285 [Acholeplasma laidlawii]OED28168.1 hypothetical protein A9268_06920 [Acholeplasma laidlawii]OWU86874.1 hypothetical protein A8G01_06925 [Acholeplasma laidlawii]PII01823.1 SIR2 family protein [Acholeplasma laidlawii]
MKISVYQELSNIMNKLSNNMKTGVFLGAGSSMSSGMPGIKALTDSVRKNSIHKEAIDKIISIEKTKQMNDYSTIEDILNSLRMIRSLTNDMDSLEIFGINGAQSSLIDHDICNDIYNTLTSKENEIVSNEDLFKAFKRFALWANSVRNSNAIEIFTTNYDLLLEKALEDREIPYFDGFIGSYHSFFHQESVENIERESSLPINWVRLWKLHGSLNWFWKKNREGDVIYRSNHELKKESDKEIVIYPSKEKYTLSRKQPFTTYFDRLKYFLIKSETLFIIQGYSFSDQHINEVIFTSLINNQRLHVMVFVYEDKVLLDNRDNFVMYKNITVYGPNHVIKSGSLFEWDFDNLSEDKFYDQFVNSDMKNVTLGDFKIFTDFLIKITTTIGGELDA